MNVEIIKGKLLKGKDFTLNRSDYIRYFGKDIPQNKYYTEKNSAIAKAVKDFGFEIKVVPEVLHFHKK